MEKKVNIFLIGSRKSGTTSLANFLGGHAEISLSTNKEPNHFDTNALERVEARKEYIELFDWSKRYRLDASTNYSTYPTCAHDLPQRLYSYNSEAKIIYVVRHPIDRIVSHYKMSYERGDLLGTLNEAIAKHGLLVHCGKYYTQLERYIDVYGRDSILILNNEDLNKENTKNKLISFLGLKEGFNKNMNRDNTSQSELRMPRALDSLLNNGIYQFLRKMFPIQFVKYIKQKLFNNLNKEIDITLNDDSLILLRKELYPELEKLQSIVDFDISNWSKF